MELLVDASLMYRVLVTNFKVSGSDLELSWEQSGLE
jgi:hypothetical protein